ncbi:MAG: F0F1 ATP synthase subunit A [Magnetococcales bacterium]|nr:F0F1 ATP synthase subunit A [Magnetococcales bacterium]
MRNVLSTTLFSLTTLAATPALASGGGEPKLDPLHHFLIKNYVDLSLFGVDISISNSVVWMWAAVAACFAFFFFAFRNATVVPGRFQSLVEIFYLLVKGMVDSVIGEEGKKFFPGILTLFFFVMFCNLIGLIPGSFTSTSQLIVTGTLAMGVFIFSTGLGFYKHGVKFLGFFVPSGLPVVLLPLMVTIEVISYLARPVSLSVRLFANMTAGHTVLGILFFYCATLPIWGGIIPFGFSIVFNAFEIFIGLVQAYIFTILTCVYINDAIHMH